MGLSVAMHIEQENFTWFRKLRDTFRYYLLREDLPVAMEEVLKMRICLEAMMELFIEVVVFIRNNEHSAICLS